MKRERICHVFSHLPELTTPRLLLRRMCVGDTEDMYEYARRSEVTRYLLWSPHPDVYYTRDYLNYLTTRYAAGSFYDWGVVCRENGRMIGTCGFSTIDCAHDVAEIGYVLNPDYRGQGFSPEAVRAVLSFGFEQLGFHRIEARFIEGNTASLRVMQKVGMQFEGYRREAMLIKGAYRTVGYCSILKQEYEKMRENVGDGLE